MIYGGAHAAAWNSHLPTPVERLLRRISATLAAISFPTFIIIILCGKILLCWLQRRDALGSDTSVNNL